MRIVGGKFAGRTLTSPNDFRVRPTAELVRVGLMKMLSEDLTGARILDLFAGTGALGLEALSRGARYVDFVEYGPPSLHALKANIAALRVREKTKVFKRDALPWAAALEAERYDIAFADPPYESRMLDRLIETWQSNRFAKILVVEHATSHELPRGYDKRIFEDTAVTIYRLEPPIAKYAKAEATAVETAPAELTSAEPTPARPAPARPAQAKSAPAKSAPAKSAPAKSAPAKSAPAKRTTTAPKSRSGQGRGPSGRGRAR